ncbi:hypothetical protein VHUM_02880 [Vanrija humicola]|uniref:Maintenance of telomere capping protein 1 n=1 Tax=Vanrija humicola TaxID=5417 RepID=A0A7D8UZZ8_VANHU|nr:hypothetical protein VHUM_02880 [Vanrija humicola]
MPPKGKKSKAEEALAFLDDLDNLEPAPGADASAPPTTGSARPSTETAAKPEAEGPPPAEADAEAASALAFLEAQINQKRAPLSGAGSTPRTATPTTAAKAAEPVAASPPPAATSGWGMSSLWSSASSALQSAQRVADEQYKKVRAEGVAGVTGSLEHLNVGGVDISKLRKEAEERIGALAKGVGNVDLDKLRHDILTQANSTFTTFINTVAPPISAHETIELWLTHPLVGYDGVEGVVYRAWLRILEQTESGELVIVWSKPEKELPSERSLNPITGFEDGWKAAKEEVEAVQAREAKKQRKTEEDNADVPVTTVPVFLQFQPVLAPLPFHEPSLLIKDSADKQASPPQHLYFIVSLRDPSHGLQFSTVTQPVPGDWLDVEYEKSDWVEERLVDVLKTGTEVIAQDYVSTRMGLKPSVAAQQTPVAEQPPAPAAEPAAAAS